MREAIREEEIGAESQGLLSPDPPCSDIGGKEIQSNRLERRQRKEKEQDEGGGGSPEGFHIQKKGCPHACKGTCALELADS